MTTQGTALDPVTFEVLKNAFASVCNEMSLAMEMSAYSLVISEGADYSGTLYDSDGHLICQGEFDLPAHCGTVPFTVQATLDAVGRENMRPGDIYIMNDPYLGGTHNNDMRTIKPVFHDGEIVGFVANTGHWPDVGGAVPGTLFLKARSAYEEGLRIPPVRIVRGGEMDEALVEVMLANMRVAAERRGDLNAHFASVNAGERRLLELIEKYGAGTVAAAMREYQDYAERLFRAEIAALPDGVYEWDDYIDYDPNAETEEPLHLHLTLTIAGDQITYDFTGTDPAAKSAVNCTFPATVSCLFISTRAIFSHVPLNHGLLRAMEVIAPEHTLVRAVHPEPVSGLAAAAFEKVINCALGVYSLMAPERTMACSFNLINVTWGGHNTATGRDFVAYVW